LFAKIAMDGTLFSVVDVRKQPENDERRWLLYVDYSAFEEQKRQDAEMLEDVLQFQRSLTDMIKRILGWGYCGVAPFDLENGDHNAAWTVKKTSDELEQMEYWQRISYPEEFEFAQKNPLYQYRTKFNQSDYEHLQISFYLCEDLPVSVSLSASVSLSDKKRTTLRPLPSKRHIHFPSSINPSLPPYEKKKTLKRCRQYLPYSC
jgi:hypothetical protein